jgi:hypothetical protein
MGAEKGCRIDGFLGSMGECRRRRTSTRFRRAQELGVKLFEEAAELRRTVAALRDEIAG